MTLGKALMAVAVALSVAQAKILAAAWTPAATLAAIATSGGAAAAGGGATVAALATVSAAAIAASVPKLAEGGIVTRPTLALIGESGPEAVIPLGRGGAGGNTFNINFNNLTVRSDEDIDILTEEISLRLAQEAERI